MDEFKKRVTINSISKVLTTGHYLPKSWGFPPFMLENEVLLAGFLENAYDIYKTFTEDEKREVLDWYETSGFEINKLFGAPDWENNISGGGTKFDLILLQKNNNDIYRAVVEKVVEEKYAQFGEEMAGIIKQKFSENPRIFETEIRRNLKP